MKIPVLLYLVFCLLGCRSSRSSSPSFASFDAHSDIPISQQYAEIIAPGTYRVYNVFALPDGEIRRLGHFDISIGQTIRIPGRPEISLQEFEVTALEVKDDELHLRSTYLPDQNSSFSHTSTIPIRE